MIKPFSRISSPVSLLFTSSLTLPDIDAVQALGDALSGRVALKLVGAGVGFSDGAAIVSGVGVGRGA